MRAGKFSLNNLFNNNKFALAFSIVAAVVIWIVIAINVSPETQRTVQNVKVNLDSESSVPAQLGLKVFGDSEYYVDVVVTGKKYFVSQTTLKAEDIEVTAITDSVTSAGNQRLELKAVAGDDYEIESISNNYIYVYYDYEKTQEFSITPQIVSTGDFSLTEDGYELGTPVLSVSTVTITGPATEIANINSVVAYVAVSGTMTNTTTLSPELKILDADGVDSFEYLTTDLSGEITMVVPVYGVKKLPTTVNFKNATSYYLSRPLSFTISPSSAEFYVSVDDYDTVENAVIGTIDFKNLSVDNNKFTFPTDMLTDVIYNGDLTDFSVTVDMTGMEQRTFTVPADNIKLINNINGSDVTVPKSLSSSVTIIGPAETLELLTAEEIFAEIDLMSETLETGTTTFDANVYTSNTTCWAYGSYTCDIVY